MLREDLRTTDHVSTDHVSTDHVSTDHVSTDHVSTDHVSIDHVSIDHDLAAASSNWRAIDRTLRALARQRAALDAEEARWLRAAYRVRIWREIGCVSMIDYMERYLGYGVRNAQERLRVALALDSLPAITGALATGHLPFSAVRSLLRVATPETEHQWLAHCANLSVHQIEDAVSGRSKGDLPTDPAQPDLEPRTLRYTDVRPSTVALEREALAKARAAVGRELADDEFLAMVFGAFLERGTATAEAPSAEATTGRAKHQVAIVVCEQCDQGWRESGGKRFALDASELARVRCDAQHIGPLETAAPSRSTQDVPPRIRRLVWRRDRGRCAIDGCRSATNLEIHHIVAREDGGTHDAWNLVLACDGCHAAIHRGLITVTGKAPDAIVVTRKHAPGAHVCAPTALDRVTIDVDAKAALVQAGFSKPEAAAATSAVRSELGDELSLEALLRGRAVRGERLLVPRFALDDGEPHGSVRAHRLLPADAFELTHRPSHSATRLRRRCVAEPVVHRACSSLSSSCARRSADRCSIS